ncbi:hypothetical protein ABG82_23235 [Mycobacteroides immunogenum]|uniref:TROVE domain-containing protein n=1 Tax=Mycobacteroides immunogenum TaxID=83262 RepID=UPI00078A00CF|nr:TROVE domain-containing protein [Mycobacteroides immunogenum]AMT72732.1 hypothetical protein ABG82_23235 [Mycobacteroides immunogenum]
MMDVLRRISRRRTPQSRPADGRQIANSAGGYTYATAEDAQLHRFLTLGTSGGTYYTSAEALTREAADVVFRAAATDPIGLVRRIVEISEAGCAPKPNPALWRGHVRMHRLHCGAGMCACTDTMAGVLWQLHHGPMRMTRRDSNPGFPLLR